jgi:hypothetical protein
MSPIEPTKSTKSNTCHKCKKAIKASNFLKCSICMNVYDLLCVKMTAKVFITMSNDSKEKWKCKNCTGLDKKLTKTQKLDTSEIQNSYSIRDNITQRKRVLQKSPSCESLSNTISITDIMSSTLINDSLSRRSLPNVSHSENSQIVELRSQVEALNTELSSAHAEIDKLNTENSGLRKQIEELQKKINIYTTLLNDDTTKRTTPAKTRYALSSPSLKSDMENKLPETLNKIKILEDEIAKLVKNNKQLQAKLSSVLKTNTQIKRKSATLENKNITLTRIQQSTKILQNTAYQLKQLSKNVTTENADSATSIHLSLPHEKENTTNNIAENVFNRREHKPKLLLLSDFHGADLLLPLSRIRKNDYDFTADIIKYGSTERVLQGLKEKIGTFTKCDSVVVMCGGSDFNINSINKVLSIFEEIAKDATHTNVIFCDIPYSIRNDADNYNNYVGKFNYALHKKFNNNCSHVWLQPNSIYLGTMEYRMNGIELNSRGKYKLAQCVNYVLKNINEAFYNKGAFL